MLTNLYNLLFTSMDTVIMTGFSFATIGFYNVENFVPIHYTRHLRTIEVRTWSREVVQHGRTLNLSLILWNLHSRRRKPTATALF